MAFERHWPAVPPQAFTADGTISGLVTVADTAGFKVKQSAVLTGFTLQPLAVQVKWVLSKTQLIVGKIDNKVGANFGTDISVYTIALSSSISAEQQPKNRVGVDDIFTALYDGDPTVGLRSVLVDKYGSYWDSANPLPISAIGPVTIRRITDKPSDGTPDNLPDAIQIGDGTNRVKVNSDGSINVVPETSPTINVVRIPYNEITSVASGVPSTIITYTTPGGITKAFLQRIQASGENIARYDLYVNSSVVATKRTYFGGDLNTTFEFSTFENAGVELLPGDTVSVKVLHTRPSLASFESTLQVVEIT